MGRRITSSPTSSTTSLPRRVERGDVDAEARSGQLTAVDRQPRVARDESGADVRAAADRVDDHVVAEPLGCPVEALVGQRRPGDAQRPQGGQVDGSSRLDPRLAARHHVRGAGAQQRDGGVGADPPLLQEVGVERVAVDHHQGGPPQQPGDDDVPHRPPGGGEPHDPIAGARVEVEGLGLEVLEQDPAVTVHDGLRQAGGTRGEQHVERVVEGHPVEREGGGFGEELRPRRGLAHLVVPVVDPDDVAHGRQPGPDRREVGGLVDVLGAVGVAADGDQDGGLDLGEPVDDAAGPELGSTGGPDRAQRGAGQERHQRLGDVRHVPGDPVAVADAQPDQPGASAADLVGEFAEGQLAAFTGLRVGDHRDGVAVLGQADHVFGVVQPRAGEPPGAGHLVGPEYLFVGAPYVEVLPDRGPERVEVVDRPLPQPS